MKIIIFHENLAKDYEIPSVKFLFGRNWFCGAQADAVADFVNLNCVYCTGFLDSALHALSNPSIFHTEIDN